MSDEKQAEQAPRSLVTKLCEAGAAVGWIEKGGYNEFHKYKYATEADIVSQLRGELFSRKVFIFPHVIRHERIPIEIETMKWSDVEKAKVPSIRKTAITELDIEWTFVDGESGEKWTVMVPGVGEDSVDKGLYKAFTGSEKYLLMKSFLLPTGDDPERDSKEEFETAKESGKVAAQKVAEGKIAAHRASKGQQTANVAPTTLFYIMPEGHNGHFAEFINMKEYASGLNEVAQEGLRQLIKPYVAKVTHEETILVSSSKLDAFLEKLAGDGGITVKKLEAKGA